MELARTDGSGQRRGAGTPANNSGARCHCAVRGLRRPPRQTRFAAHQIGSGVAWATHRPARTRRQGSAGTPHRRERGRGRGRRRVEGSAAASPCPRPSPSQLSARREEERERSRKQRERGGDEKLELLYLFDSSDSDVKREKQRRSEPEA